MAKLEKLIIKLIDADKDKLINSVKRKRIAKVDKTIRKINRLSSAKNNILKKLILKRPKRKLRRQASAQYIHSRNNDIELEVMFNPTTMNYSKEVAWVDSLDRREEDREMQYDMIRFKKLEIQLLFDFTMNNDTMIFKDYFDFFELITSEQIAIEARADNKHDATRADTIKRPPVLILIWGENSNEQHFNHCVVTNLDWSYEMFNRKGDVLRAIANITFEQVRMSGVDTESNMSARVNLLDLV